MFFRANSSERIERKGRYVCKITDLHNQGVFHSKDILLALLDTYIENAASSKVDPNSFRGGEFRLVSFVETLKKTISTSSEMTYAAKVIRTFNQSHLTMHPNDDIFFLLSAFLSTFEYHLPKLNSALRGRLCLGDKRQSLLVESFDIMMLLMDKIFEKKRDYHAYLYWLIEQLQYHKHVINDTLLINKVDYWQNKRNIFLDAHEIRLLNKKIREMRSVLPGAPVKASVDMLIKDMEHFVDVSNAPRFKEMLEELISINEILNQEQFKEIDKVLLKINNPILIETFCNVASSRPAFFSTQLFVPMLKSLCERLKESFVHRVDICRVLIATKAIKDSDVLQAVISFLFVEITKRGQSDSFDTLLACRCFFDLEDSKRYALRHPVIAKIRSILKDSSNVLIRAEYVVLLEKLNEEISTEKDFNEKAYIEKLASDLFNFSLSSEGAQHLIYVCRLVKLLQHHLSLEFKENIITDQVKSLNDTKDGLNERVCSILSCLKEFIPKKAYPFLLVLSMKLLDDSFFQRNIVFLSLILELKSIFPDELNHELAQYIFKKFCSSRYLAGKNFSSFSVLLKEFSEFYSQEQILNIVSMLVDLIRNGQRQAIAFYGEGDLWLNVTIYLKFFLPRLTLDQKIMFLDILAFEAMRENHFAHLVYSNLYISYREEIVKDLMLRVKAESGQPLPAEMVEDIITFSYSGARC